MPACWMLIAASRPCTPWSVTPVSTASPTSSEPSRDRVARRIDRRRLAARKACSSVESPPSAVSPRDSRRCCRAPTSAPAARPERSQSRDRTSSSVRSASAGATTVPSIGAFLFGAATLPLPSNVWPEPTQSRLPPPCQPIQGDRFYVEHDGSPPLLDRRSRRGAGRSSPTRGGDTVARPRDGQRPVAGRAAGEAAGPGHLLGHRLRLAEGGGAAERLAAVCDQPRRARHPLRARPLPASERAAAAHDPRLARLDRRALEDHRSAHGPHRHGGRADDAFDVVLPSIPGYGFSEKPTSVGWDPDHIARAWAELMGRLGYDRYVARGGDWGSPISSAMARQAPKGLLGIHVNLAATVPPEVAAVLGGGGPAPAGLSEKQRAAFDSLSTSAKEGDTSYSVMKGTRPQTIGYALTDSPAGLAAWMLVHPGFAQWTYGDGDPEKSLTNDEVLDDITLYWLTNTAASSARLYWENGGRRVVLASAQKTDEISLPVAITVFPEEIYRAPETWARRAYRNLIYFHEVDKGGHFAAWEEPELFAAEIRAAFRSLRLAGEPEEGAHNLTVRALLPRHYAATSI